MCRFCLTRKHSFKVEVVQASDKNPPQEDYPMKLIKILTLVSLFAFASMAAGCGKKDKDKTKTDPSAQKVNPGDTPVEPKTPEPVAEPSADMEKGLEITEKLADVFDANKDDCAKMATEIGAFYAANKDAIEMSKKLATTMTPEAGKEFATKHAERIAAYSAKMAGAAKCMADPAVMEAMKVMSPEAPKAADPAKAEPAKTDKKAP